MASALGGSNSGTLTVATKLLPSAIAGTPYVVVLDAAGGTPSYTWGIATGKLPSGISLSPNTGTISGTPTVTGTFPIGVTLSDASNPTQTGTSNQTITVAPVPLAIVASAQPSATVGAAYALTLRATGGTPSYTWSITSGTLPAGLKLGNSTGMISGTPTAIGAANFGVTVRDHERPVQTQSIAMSISVASKVAPTPLTITPSALASVMVGVAYYQALHVTGGTAPYTWSITSGSLPAGLALTLSTGAISGTPATSGTSTFIATVTDSSYTAQSASATMAVVVTPTHLAIAPSALPSVGVGSPYSQVLRASGGTAPYVWSITSGKLPTGLTLTQSTGTISGTPTSSGSPTLTATVTDSGSPAQSATSTLTVVVTPNLLFVTSSALPQATVGAAYSQTLQASGGTSPYAWSITSGKLPRGLTLIPSTGTISGTPIISAPFNFTTTVTDSSIPAQTASAAATVAVASTSLTILTSSLPPSSAGVAYSQNLQVTGGIAPYTWSMASGQLPGGLSLSSSGVISGTTISSGSSSFRVTVSDSSVPAQTYTSAMTIVSATRIPLTITSVSLSAGTNGASYSQTLQASGGTPAYTWSITSGNLPAGLTLAATTGVISGTPTANGVSNFTATVSDNGNPVQTQFAATTISVNSTPVATGPGTTWYVRSDGGTRYSSNVFAGQCDGKSDVAYPGSGTNQHCAYNDFRYLWDDNSGAVGKGAWVIAGGDTVIVRGCAALPGQQNPSGSNCRIGWDHSTGSGLDSSWCYGVGSYDCFNPTIPAGTSSQHTRILGQNYAACNTGSATNPKLYESNLTQIYGGFSLAYTLDMRNTQYVDVQCLEITSHNGVCTGSGSPAYPRGCNTSQPLDDYAVSGIYTNNATSNIALQDVYIHGFNSSGLFGPIGGPIAMTRMFVGFNEFAAWNFDDGYSTPDAAGSSITANHVIMEGNGCYEEYPVVDAFPAQVCYDTNSQGFGDSWSGQNTALDSMYCNDCQNLYNTKDGFIGPHTWITTLTVTNSTSIGNMGQDWKWGGNTSPNNTTFTNNLTVGNCMRMSQPMPGAPSTYNKYLTGFCRAAGNVVASVIPAGSTWLIANNSWVTYQPTVFDIACPAGLSPCPSTVNIVNNVFLGYGNPNSPYGLSTPGLYYIEDPAIHVASSHNVEYGTRNDDCAGGGTGTICKDPLLVGEPAQGTVPPESTLDNFNFHLTSSSPAIGAGTIYSVLPSADYFGTFTSNPAVIGAVEP